MLKLYSLSAAFLLAALGFGLQAPQAKIVPMNVRTGLWETHTVVAVSGAIGIPPGMAAKMTPAQQQKYAAAMAAMSGQKMESTDKSCLTQKDLTDNPESFLNPNDKLKCIGQVVNSTSNEIELQTTCNGEAQLTMHIKIHASDSEHASGQGEGNTTIAGKTMKSTYTMDSHWLGATCPKDLQH
ncbi:MAG TPA: DUF3617 family protein [Terriglobales bacterium]|nr:DUF3617 family protein [Terriglobales bacterium]